MKIEDKIQNLKDHKKSTKNSFNIRIATMKEALAALNKNRSLDDDNDYT